MLSNDYIKQKSKTLLTLDDTDAYDDLLDILIPSGIAKMEMEGVPNCFDEGSNYGFQYVRCLAYELAIGLNMEADDAVVTRQYMTGVNELRCYIRQLETSST